MSICTLRNMSDIRPDRHTTNAPAVTQCSEVEADASQLVTLNIETIHHSGEKVYCSAGSSRQKVSTVKFLWTFLDPYACILLIIKPAVECALLVCLTGHIARAFEMVSLLFIDCTI